MYSFEGEYRRKPQQNLSGASSRGSLSKDALIMKAQQERQKRQQQKLQIESAVKIQAVIRSFLTRIRFKRAQRSLFDQTLQRKDIQFDKEIVLLLRRLLYFYNTNIDLSRLIFLSQQLIKQWTNIIQNGATFLQIRRLLVLHLRLLNPRNNQNNDSLAVPLRMLEVFTCIESASQATNPESAKNVIADTLYYLVKRGYFKELRSLLESKTPPLYGVSSTPPTPLAGSIFNLISRPITLVPQLHNFEYSKTVMLEFSSAMLCPEMTEVVRLFIMPAMISNPDFTFPMLELIQSLASHISEENSSSTKNKNKAYCTTVDYSIWLLCALLMIPSKSLSEQMIKHPSSPVLKKSYLVLMAKLTSNLTINHFLKQINNDDSDSDAEDDSSDHFSEESRIHIHCVDMLSNDDNTLLSICASASINEWDGQSLEAISQICHNLLLNHKNAIHKYKLLYTLAFKPGFLRCLWEWMNTLEDEAVAMITEENQDQSTSLLEALARGCIKSSQLLPPLTTFCALYSLLLATSHDEEFGEMGISHHTFSFTQMEHLCVTLRQVCMGLIEVAFPETRSISDKYRSVLSSINTSNEANELSNLKSSKTMEWAYLFKLLVRLLRQLHSRDQRMHFTQGTWEWGVSAGWNPILALPLLEDVIRVLMQPMGSSQFRHYKPFKLNKHDNDDAPLLSVKKLRTLTILKEIPFVIPFSQRLLIYQGLVHGDRKKEQRGELVNFLQGPSINISVRRSHIYEDAFDKLSPMNEPNMRLKMRVQLMNEAGMEEAGVDGGGVFREFLTDLLKTACDPNRGFFRLTKDNMLYPNPAVHLIVEHFDQHYYFIGRILGKALYENLLVELPFAEFFLQSLVGESGVGSGDGEADIHRLAALDERLHKSLLQLRSLPADAVLDLGLDFTVMSDELGEQKVEELKPGGANIPVTAENRIEFIHLVAEWKLSKQMKAQVTAMRKGLASVIPLPWLRIFSAKEFRLLISGAESAVDVEDLKRHTNYSGGYFPEHKTIQCFWRVVENFSDNEKRQLLKFVTSCSRPPLLGFKDLDPAFCIQNAGPTERLPTAATCMNLLKLPNFSSEDVLKEKLLYAISSGAGFELS